MQKLNHNNLINQKSMPILNNIDNDITAKVTIHNIDQIEEERTNEMLKHLESKLSSDEDEYERELRKTQNEEWFFNQITNQSKDTSHINLENEDTMDVNTNDESQVKVRASGGNGDNKIKQIDLKDFKHEGQDRSLNNDIINNNINTVKKDEEKNE